jgi:hypothetical protein
MPQKYWPAPEVEDVANDLIHDFHSHLASEHLVYIFLDEAPVSKGRVQMGRAKIATGLNAWLATEKLDREPEPAPFFIVEIAKKYWDVMTAAQRRALVDHELHHCWVDEEGKLSVQPHDVEEFNSVIARHGLWWQDVQTFAETVMEAKQRGLFDNEAKREDKRGVSSVTISGGGRSVTLAGNEFKKAAKKIGRRSGKNAVN